MYIIQQNNNDGQVYCHAGSRLVVVIRVIVALIMLFGVVRRVVHLTSTLLIRRRHTTEQFFLSIATCGLHSLFPVLTLRVIVLYLFGLFD